MIPKPCHRFYIFMCLCIKCVAYAHKCRLGVYICVWEQRLNQPECACVCVCVCVCACREAISLNLSVHFCVGGEAISLNLSVHFCMGEEASSLNQSVHVCLCVQESYHTEPECVFGEDGQSHWTWSSSFWLIIWLSLPPSTGHTGMTSIPALTWILEICPGLTAITASTLTHSHLSNLTVKPLKHWRKKKQNKTGKWHWKDPFACRVAELTLWK